MENEINKLNEMKHSLMAASIVYNKMLLNLNC